MKEIWPMQISNRDPILEFIHVICWKFCKWRPCGVQIFFVWQWGGLVNDSLSSESEQPDPGGIIMISPPIIAHLFIESQSVIIVSGYTFRKFDSNKDAEEAVFVGFDMDFEAVELAQAGCLVSWIK